MTTSTRTLAISLGSYGLVRICDDPDLQARLSVLRQRVSWNAARKPIGKKIWGTLFIFDSQVRELGAAQHGELREECRYAIEGISLEALEEAERLNAEGKAAAAAQGPTYQCRERGCQHRVRYAGDYCARCAHDA